LETFSFRIAKFWSMRVFDGFSMLLGNYFGKLFLELLEPLELLKLFILFDILLIVFR
jgi:hypothetical protein